jgi:hypothetical protein
MYISLILSASGPCPVPKGHSKIAQRFNVGTRHREQISPEGTAEILPIHIGTPPVY